MTTLEEHLREIYETAYNGCDPAVLDNPRQAAQEWVRVGYRAGLKDGQEIRAQIDGDDEKAVWRESWELGHTQGLAYAAYIASHCEMVSAQDDPPALFVSKVMREIIVEAINGAMRAQNMRRRT